jgi:hypothetical protein
LCEKEPKYKIGDKVKHRIYGEGVILGNYHKRGSYWYWHIKYFNNTFGYNTESNLKIIEE